MAGQEYFKKALTDFTFDLASGGAIRHLADKGYTARQIADELDVLVPYEKIQNTVWDYLVKSQVLLLDEPGAGTPLEQEVFVEECGKYGKKSFRRVKIRAENTRQIHWEKKDITVKSPMELTRFLSEKCLENGTKTAYMACDFGIWKEYRQERYQELQKILDLRQEEYLEGLPWAGKRVYHQLNPRMADIAGRMVLMEAYEGWFYFMETKEKYRAGT